MTKEITGPAQGPHACTECGEWVHSKRWDLGYTLCRGCGEAAARRARASWTVAPAGHKQGYTLHTDRTLLVGLNKSER